MIIALNSEFGVVIDEFLQLFYSHTGWEDQI